MSQRADERAAILTAIELACAAHADVAAAWLIGSFGRGTHDDWSDLDVWVVTDGPAADLIKTPGEPLLTVEAVQNAPHGGAFFTCACSSSTEPTAAPFTSRMTSPSARFASPAGETGFTCVMTTPFTSSRSMT